LVLAREEQTYQEEWSTKSFAEEAAVFRKAASILREKLNYFGRLITLEMGKLYA
jgi:acyl-CoA reductase-like NAD-dependent aldehyde dehydrogenase